MESVSKPTDDISRSPEVSDGAQAAAVQQAIDSAPEISVLPQIVAKVIDLAQDISTSAREIERVVSVDPGFCARLLKLANSAYFGLPRKVSSIRDAIVLLGGQNIRNLALTVSCYDVFIGKTDADSLLRRELWRHCVLCATCSRSLCAHRSECPSDQGFVAGLLHDVGKPVLLSGMRDQAVAARELERAKGITSVEAEIETFGFDHAKVGAALAGRWNLPELLVCAIENHHSVGVVRPGPALALTASAALADSIVHIFESISRSHADDVPEHVSVDDLDIEAAAVLGIGEEDLSGVVMTLVSEIGNAPTLQSLAA